MSHFIVSDFDNFGQVVVKYDIMNDWKVSDINSTISFRDIRVISHEGVAPFLVPRQITSCLLCLSHLSSYSIQKQEICNIASVCGSILWNVKYVFLSSIFLDIWFIKHVLLQK